MSIDLRSTPATRTRRAEWTPVCAYTDLLPERGACVLLDGRQIAVFRCFDGSLYAVGNRDPFSGAYVLSRGIVGTRGGEPMVVSPMHKQAFSLVTGRCLDDPRVSIPTYPIRLADGLVEVRTT
ncbi:nitrite reductase small subunit NirD [Thermostaphylospora chromogena]|uniref:Nitrite reductase (NADH) small subunit n=1 Tax=Thermostaphylospora chromogena TaxID=35622 RepID=A0A1H1HIZ5_9ACTN|nr:nitrite reductase small subunit NirD [Thermostaphylospora chromogena]SDR25349.1 nitrite reductase (NADH) small subunit [Thermostaphylospora chromogena]